MLNEIISLVATELLNETNISIDISKVIVESGSSSNFDFLEKATPIASVLVTVYLAIWTIKANYRNIIVQMNQSEIMKNIKELATTIRTTNEKNDVVFFVESDKGIYIPSPLRKNILKMLKKEKSDKVSEISRQKMLESINEYIT